MFHSRIPHAMSMSSKSMLVLAALLWTICAASLAGVLLGGHHLFVKVPAVENACTMTYMWSHYYPVPMVNRSRLAFKYLLQRYSHEELDEDDRDVTKTDKVLLFVPGSAGSAAQVRSIGSEVMNLLKAQRMPRSNIAVYTLDFGEEPSVLSGLFLEDQVEFLKDSLRRIGELHNQPKTLLFAHSMGGVVARMVMKDMDAPELEPALAILDLEAENLTISSIVDTTEDAEQFDIQVNEPALENSSASADETEPVEEGSSTGDLASASETFSAEDAGSVSTSEDSSAEKDTTAEEETTRSIPMRPAVSLRGLYTMSSPHQDPVVGVDVVIPFVYTSLRDHVDRERVYVSLAGGYRDVLVPSALAQLDKSQYTFSTSSLTSTIPGVEKSTDHLAILWCNELVKRLAKHAVEALNGKELAVLSSPGLQSKRIPRAGFTKAEMQAMGPGFDLIGSFFTDTVARRYALCILPGLFGSVIFLTLVFAGAPTKELAFYIMVFAVALKFFESPSYPLTANIVGVTATSGLAVGGLILLAAQILLRWLPRVLVLMPQIIGLGLMVSNAMWGQKWIPEGTDMFALALLWLVAYTITLILANLSAARQLWKLDTPLDAPHLQVLFSLAYIPVVAVTSCAALYGGLALFRPVLSFEDHFPVVTEKLPRGVYHAVLQNELPETVSLEDGGRIHTDRYASYAYAVIIWSLVTLVPITFHLHTLFYYPRYASAEKVLDSQYKYIRVKDPSVKKNVEPEEDESTASSSEFNFAFNSKDGAKSTETSSKSKKSKKKKKSQSAMSKSDGTSSSLSSDDFIEATEYPDGSVEYEDTLYIRDKSLCMIQFENGDVVQMDDLEDLTHERQEHPDAVPLIEQSASSSEGTKLMCELNERIRSAVYVFPQSLILRVIFGVVSMCALALNPGQLYLLQVAGAVVATAWIVLRFDDRAVERQERRLVPPKTKGSSPSEPAA